MIFRRGTFFTAVVLFFLPAVVSAGRPLETRDLTLVGRGHFDLEIGTEFRQSDDKITSWVGDYKMSYGLFNPLEMSIRVPFTYDQERAGLDSVTGLSDMNMELKLLFAQERQMDEPTGMKGSPASGLYGFLKLPTGNVAEGLGTGTIDGGFGLLMAQTVNLLLFEFNFGYTLYDGRDNLFLYAVAIKTLAGGGVTLGTEVVGETDFSSGGANERVDLRAGFTLDINEYIIFDAAAIFGLTAATPDYGATFGLTAHL